MSTMYDALRKAEAEHKKTAGLDVKKPENGDFKSSDGMPENTKIMILLAAVIVVFTIAFNVIKSSLAGPRKSALVHSAVTPQVPGPAVAAPASSQRAPGTYGLDGVIDAGDNSIAIVNGKLLKINESIDSLTLKKISSKEVELLNTKDNSTVILKIAN